MRRFIPLLVSILAAVICCINPVSVETPEDSFAVTRNSASFDGTIWECRTDEQYNQYLLFKDEEVRIFCGLVVDGELQRWSEYKLVSKPIWGRINPSTELIVGDHVFHYFGVYSESLEELWMSITVNIVPWQL